MIRSEVGVRVFVQREKVRFVSGGSEGDSECVAWHYPGTNGACVVMAGALGMTKEPSTDLFAKRFNDAGFAVLAFDYRHLGESGGRPRQVVRVGGQLADWRAAIRCAAGLPGVDPTRLAAWGFSLSGAHIFRVAAAGSGLAAAIAQSASADGQATSQNMMHYQKPSAMLRFTLRGILDALGGLVGREPLLVPLAGQPGTLAALVTPDALDVTRALDPDARYPEWQRTVAARSALRLGFYRPGRHAARVACPLLVLVCDEDRSALAEPAVRAAGRAPGAELVRVPGGHYAPFLDAHEQAVEAELAFLRRHLLQSKADADSSAVGPGALPGPQR